MTIEAELDQLTAPAQTTFRYDVCVVGTGRVGLPLALSLMEAGLETIGVDTDPNLRDSVNRGRMPFSEPGFDELVGSRRLVVEADAEVVAQSRAIVITVGTPLMNHVEADLSQIHKVLANIRPYLRPDQLLCLRSTVGPGTTEFVRKWIERHTDLRVGVDLFLAFCPERIAEGKAREELHTLPQIVGSQDPESGRRAQELFGRLTKETLPTDWKSAELVKLFNNILRYVHFALANQFALVADDFGANIHEIRALANHGYPRSFLAAPGMTAGTCLRKDFGMLNEWSPYPDMLLSAWKMNEYVPAFLVQHLSQRVDLHDQVVAVLGFTFKQDTDDLRDSLAPKLWRYVNRQMPVEVRVTDHHLADPIPEPSAGNPRNWDLDEALDGAGVVFVATNHTGYREALQRLARKAPDTWVADIWNVGGTDQIFYRAGEVLAGATTDGEHA